MIIKQTIGVFSLWLWVVFAAQAEGLRFAFSTYPPFQILNEEESPHHSGIDIDIARMLAAKLGLELKVQVCPFSRCLRLMELGQLDLISSVLKRPDREVYMYYFKQPYIKSTPKAFYIHQAADFSIQKHADLYDLLVGVTQGEKYEPRFDGDERLKKYKVRETAVGLRMVANGRLDAFIKTEAVGDYVASTLGLRDKVSKAVLRLEDQSASYMAISKNSPLSHRMDDINNAHNALLKEGSVAEILSHYQQRFDVDD